jgi:peptide chain release factor 3
MTWPVGKGKGFGGIMNLRTQAMTVFESGQRAPAAGLRHHRAGRHGHAASALRPRIRDRGTGMELAIGASPTWDHAAFLAGKQTPVFFGSGVNNFGVMEVLEALVDLAPPPQPRTSN